jgi:hypothetical protein
LHVAEILCHIADMALWQFNDTPLDKESESDLWTKLNHYVFWFHDSTFECLAESYKFEVTNESVAELLTRVQQKLLTH